ncbi:RecX family transcriptional regulator [Candidatus Microgenomates bacterium]|nr:RecX family transcriptional regulator [Candidatus Microgenomates bacterium]
MQVTLLTPQKNDPKRVNVFIDDKFFCALPLIEVVTLRLKEGLQLTEKQLMGIWQKNLQTRLTDLALNYLSFRPHSEKEVREHLQLKLKKFKGNDAFKNLQSVNSQELINDILVNLRSKDYLNDVNFSKWWIEQRQTFKKKGRKLIDFELRQKGISDDNIEQAWSLPEDKLSESDIAMAFIKKKESSLERLSPKVQREKIYSWLTARGFSYETIKDVIDTLLSKD